MSKALEPDPPMTGLGANPSGAAASAPDRGLASEADARLVRAVLGGDREAFTVLVTRHEKKAVAVSFRILGRMEDALDVVQDAFLKAYRALDTLKDARLFGSWLMRIVSNYSLNFRRDRKRSAAVALEDVFGGDEDASPDRLADDQVAPVGPGGNELAGRIQAALAQLPDRQRLALVLFSIEGLSQKDVADVLDCSEEAVKWHVFEARRKLKDWLAQDLEG